MNKRVLKDELKSFIREPSPTGGDFSFNMATCLFKWVDSFTIMILDPILDKFLIPYTVEVLIAVSKSFTNEIIEIVSNRISEAVNSNDIDIFANEIENSIFFYVSSKLLEISIVESNEFDGSFAVTRPREKISLRHNPSSTEELIEIWTDEFASWAEKISVKIRKLTDGRYSVLAPLDWNLNQLIKVP
jgi:hypothetical protein